MRVCVFVPVLEGTCQMSCDKFNVLDHCSLSKAKHLASLSLNVYYLFI